ncbi:hypothetical protein MKW94_022765 [Papaver nudicaule]|uniref:peptidylprolyl isomerase n=1 Tax=Papaver nudicaule TaxID=74823 RepID=A0AA41VZT8_PAPNU|nr:hypothetical protein [Papaver nudicaule]
MAACTFRSLTQCQCILSSVSCLHETGQIHKQQQNNTRQGIQFGTQSKVTRRLVLESIGFTAALLNVAHPVAAAPMPDSMEPEVLRTRRQADGVIIQDVVDGIGIAAQEGDLVEVNYVCRRSNGYFVHSTVDQFNGESKPVILPLDDKQIIRGLKQVLIGMKVGGKRRALIPPSVGYVNENLKPIPEEFGPRRSLLSHASEPLVFEVQLLKVL